MFGLARLADFDQDIRVSRISRRTQQERKSRPAHMVGRALEV